MNYKLILFAGISAITIAACHKENDHQKPTISISTPHQGDSVKAGDMIYLKGSAKDNDAVHEITYEFRKSNNDSLYLSNSFHVHMGDADFSDSMKMPAADVNITVKAEDHAGNEAEVTLNIHQK